LLFLKESDSQSIYEAKFDVVRSALLHGSLSPCLTQDFAAWLYQQELTLTPIVGVYPAADDTTNRLRCFMVRAVTSIFDFYVSVHFARFPRVERF
jgi:hypothetical protein